MSEQNKVLLHALLMAASDPRASREALEELAALGDDPDRLAELTGSAPQERTIGKRRRSFVTKSHKSKASGADDEDGGAPARKFSSTQFDLADAGYSRSQGSPMEAVLRLAASIPDRDLAEDGREDTPHVTVKYGLHADDPEAVRRVVAGFGPVEVTLGGISLFPAKEEGIQRGGEAFDVVKLDIGGDRLHKLNALLADSLPHTDTHPTYSPHLTLAYVKPGAGRKYAGKSGLEGQKLSLRHLVFSGKDRGRTVIDIAGRADEPESGADLARWYARWFDALEESGLEPTPDDIAEAEAELDGSGWSVGRDDSGDWRARPTATTVKKSWRRLDKAAQRAPAGFTRTNPFHFNGRDYVGGQFIPGKAVESASPADREKLAQAKESEDRSAEAKKQARGSQAVDLEALKRSVAPAHGLELTAPERGNAARAYAALKRHHGGLTLHRVAELAGKARQALDAVGDDHPNAEGLRDYWSRQLAAIASWVGRAEGEGMTGEAAVKPAAEPVEAPQTPGGSPALSGESQPRTASPVTSTSHTSPQPRPRKPIWQSTRGEVVASGATHKAGELLASGHRVAVMSALMEGEMVPARVLAEYPGIEAEVRQAVADQAAESARQRTVNAANESAAANARAAAAAERQAAEDAALGKASDRIREASYKEPWEITIREYTVGGRITNAHRAAHRAEVAQALSEGKPVPFEVAQEYPSLLQEAKFTGPLTDSAGRTYQFVDGKRVAAGAHKSGGQGPVAGPENPPPSESLGPRPPTPSRGGEGIVPEGAAAGDLDDRIRQIDALDAATPTAKRIRPIDPATVEVIRDELRANFPGVRVRQLTTKLRPLDIRSAREPFTVEENNAIRRILRRHGIVQMWDGKHMRDVDSRTHTIGGLVQDADGQHPMYAGEEQTANRPSWAMTAHEFASAHADYANYERLSQSGGTSGRQAVETLARISRQHADAVEHAILAGRPVPSAVLKDHPGLVAKHGGSIEQVEPGFTGTLTDSAGRTYQFVDGKRAAAGGEGAPAPRTHAVFQGRGRADQSGIYAAGQGPVLDGADYYAFDERSAGRYGPDVSRAEVSLSSPAEITSDRDWLALAREAGVPSDLAMSTTYGGDKSQVLRAKAKLREYLVARGHDGLVVRLDPKQETRRTSRIFGHDQLVKFRDPASLSENSLDSGDAPGNNAPVDAQPREEPTMPDSNETPAAPTPGPKPYWEMTREEFRESFEKQGRYSHGVLRRRVEEEIGRAEGERAGAEARGFPTGQYDATIRQRRAELARLGEYAAPTEAELDAAYRRMVEAARKSGDPVPDDAYGRFGVTPPAAPAPKTPAPAPAPQRATAPAPTAPAVKVSAPAGVPDAVSGALSAAGFKVSVADAPGGGKRLTVRSAQSQTLGHIDVGADGTVEPNIFKQSAAVHAALPAVEVSGR